MYENTMMFFFAVAALILFTSTTQQRHTSRTESPQTGSGVVGGPWVGYESEEMRKLRNAIEFLQHVGLLPGNDVRASGWLAFYRDLDTMTPPNMSHAQQNLVSQILQEWLGKLTHDRQLRNGLGQFTVLVYYEALSNVKRYWDRLEWYGTQNNCRKLFTDVDLNTSGSEDEDEAVNKKSRNDTFIWGQSEV